MDDIHTLYTKTLQMQSKSGVRGEDLAHALPRLEVKTFSSFPHGLHFSPREKLATYFTAKYASRRKRRRGTYSTNEFQGKMKRVVECQPCLLCIRFALNGSANIALPSSPCKRLSTLHQRDDEKKWVVALEHLADETVTKAFANNANANSFMHCVCSKDKQHASTWGHG